MKKYKVNIEYPWIMKDSIFERRVFIECNKKTLKALNDKIAIYSLFWNIPETFTDLLNVGDNFIDCFGYIKINEVIKDFFKLDEPKQFTLRRTIYTITLNK